MATVANLTVHRLPRNSENSFTMIPNSILRDPNMSCKAKAVLMYLLGEKDNSHSSPDKDMWTLTIKGLTAAFKESVGSIRRSLNELMSLGYLVRTDVLNKHNLRIRSEYTIYEEPIENPDGKPLKRYEDEEYQNRIETIKKEKEETNEAAEEAVRTVLKNTMDFELLSNEYGYDVADNIIKITSEGITNKHYLWLGKLPVRPSDFAKKVYSLNYLAVADIIEKTNEKQDIQNKNKYILTSLYHAGKKINAPADGVLQCVQIMKQFILAYKYNNHVSWWNSNNSFLSDMEREVIRQFIYDKYKWDSIAYNNVISKMQNY